MTAGDRIDWMKIVTRGGNGMGNLRLGNRVRYVRDTSRTGTVIEFTNQEVRVRWDSFRTIGGDDWTCVKEKNLSLIN